MELQAGSNSFSKACAAFGVAPPAGLDALAANGSTDNALAAQASTGKCLAASTGVTSTSAAGSRRRLLILHALIWTARLMTRQRLPHRKPQASRAFPQHRKPHASRKVAQHRKSHASRALPQHRQLEASRALSQHRKPQASRALPHRKPQGTLSQRQGVKSALPPHPKPLGKNESSS